MTSLPRRTTRAALLLVLSVLLGASFAPGLAAAQAAQVTVTLTATGPQPEFIEVPVGGTVLFVNDDDQQHQVRSTVAEGASTPWEFDSGVLAPKDGETRASAQTPPFEAAGRYTFRDTRGLLLTTTFDDEIGVRAPEPAGPGPSDQPSGEPSPSGSPGEGGAPAAGQPGQPGQTGPSGSAQPGGGGAPPPSGPGSPPPTGGTGTTGPLPLTGGFGSFGSTPQPIPGLDPLAPAIAPPLELPSSSAAAPVLPELAAPQVDAPTGALPLATGSLPGNPTGRSYGLPAALALVSIVGVVSLLVRALLAEPAARRGELALRPVTVTVAA